VRCEEPLRFSSGSRQQDIQGLSCPALAAMSPEIVLALRDGRICSENSTTGKSIVFGILGPFVDWFAVRCLKRLHGPA
jgi:hypothetical protein